MSGGRIMVVDDDAELLGFTCKYLTRLGYPAEPYRRSEDAWNRFSASTEYSLVVIDLSIPGISGLELSRMMLTARPAVRLILTSGYPFDTQRIGDAGPDRMTFLHKPFTPSMLKAAVERMMRVVRSDRGSAAHAD